MGGVIAGDVANINVGFALARSRAGRSALVTGRTAGVSSPVPVPLSEVLNLEGGFAERRCLTIVVA
jgi:hypothetical protein